MIKVGETIPLNIEVLNEKEDKVTLKEFLGKYLVLYFYPKDDTPGCTTEACELRDFNKDITKLGATIVGISKDKIKSHLKFKEKYNLPFPLLSDESTQLQQAFGIWAEKKFMGRTYMGTLRTTYLVDPEGKVVHIWENVNPKGHGQEVFERVKQEAGA
ncbi:MAG: thioredoxin-dependent thiol peroxidase [Candidatus Dojkabacteria bacterium]|nr:MAG: thioredoxin-dependent thiol peroxidase [Candidatus Dojkabacteria bacterium]